MEVVHRRVDHGVGVIWLSDLTRPFVIVLLQTDVTHVLGGWAHLGVAVESRAEVDRARCRRARRGLHGERALRRGTAGGVLGDRCRSDGHHLELAYGQEVGVTVAEHRLSAGE
jgi:hypothetical protein